MFKNKRIMAGVLTVLLMAVSFFISREVTSIYDNSYWYTLCSIWASEFFLGLVVTELMKTDKHAMAILLGNLLIATIYFIFTLLSVFIFTGNVSSGTLLIIHISALLLVVIMHVLLGVAHESTRKDFQNQQMMLQGKKLFAQKLEEFKLRHRNWMNEDAGLEKAVIDLQDELRFSPESIIGSEESDQQVLDALEALLKAEDAALAIKETSAVKDALVFRKNIIKISR